MKKMRLLFLLPLLSLFVSARPQTTSPQTSSAQSARHDKPIVFLNGNGNIQSTAGNVLGTTYVTTTKHDQTIEMAKDFADCKGVTTTLKQESADYSMFLNHEGNNHNQVMVTKASGEILMTDTAHGLHQSVKDKVAKVCAAIVSDWMSNTPQK